MLQSRLFALALGALVALATAIPTVDLRTSGDYAILAKTGVSTVPASVIYGDLGLSPISATAFTGFSYIEKPLLGFAKSTQVCVCVYLLTGDRWTEQPPEREASSRRSS
jgi:hypothetical protein